MEFQIRGPVLLKLDKGTIVSFTSNNNNNNNNNCLKSNIQCIEIRVQWTVTNEHALHYRHDHDSLIISGSKPFTRLYIIKLILFCTGLYGPNGKFRIESYAFPSECDGAQ